jgi:hypothetical protein
MRIRLKGSERPSRAASAMAAIVGSGMILSVIGFLTAPAVGIAIFIVTWIVTVVLIIGYHLVNLFAPEEEAPPISVTSLNGTVDRDTPEEDWDEKLRKLEALERDGLISAEEYR